MRKKAHYCPRHPRVAYALRTRLSRTGKRTLGRFCPKCAHAATKRWRANKPEIAKAARRRQYLRWKAA